MSFRTELAGLGRYVLRRLVFLAALAACGAILAMLTTGNAKAQSYANCASGLNEAACPDQGQAAHYAYKACKASIPTRPESIRDGLTCEAPAPHPYESFQMQSLMKYAGSVYAAYNRTYPAGQTCATRADLGGLYQSNFQNGPKVCSYGCEYTQTTVKSDQTITDKSNPSNSLRFGILLGGKANGNTCINPDGRDKPKEKGEEPPPCLAVGSDSAGTIYHCPKEDGGSCTISGRGTKFCHPPPGETEGPKVDTGRQDGSSQSTGPNNPPQPPAPRPGEGFTPNGPGSGICNNVSGSCSNVTTYSQSGTPNTNGQPVTGDGSKDGKGQQETGSGSGTGTGTGGTGTTGPNMDATNALLGDIKGKVGEIADGMNGDAGEGVGDDLYEKSETTVGELFTDYRGRVTDSEIGNSIGSFFSVNGGGACPTISIPASMWWEAMSTDMLCTGPVAVMLVAGGWLVLAMAAFFALTRVALY